MHHSRYLLTLNFVSFIWIFLFQLWLFVIHFILSHLTIISVSCNVASVTAVHCSFKSFFFLNCLRYKNMNGTKLSQIVGSCFYPIIFYQKVPKIVKNANSQFSHKHGLRWFGLRWHGHIPTWIPWAKLSYFCYKVYQKLNYAQYMLGIY